MEIYESGPAYRGFLRSGAYPALSKRVMRGGGVVARGASWLALVAVASTAGYNVTQRLVAPPPVAAPAAAVARTALDVPTAHAVQAARPSAPAPRTPAAGSVVSNAPMDETTRPHASRAQAPVRASKPRAAAAVAAEVAPAASLVAVDEALVAQPLQPAVAGDELMAPGTQAAAIAPVAPVAAVAPIAQVTLPAQALQASAHSASTPLPAVTRAAATSVSSLASTASPTPVNASAKIAALRVNGSLSTSNVRRGLARISPSLSACYAEAVHRAGYPELSSVKVALTIDETGRVKSHPDVAGADLPGFGACLSSALSHLVCPAPDTGTATAALTLRFAP